MKKLALTSLLTVFAVSGAHAANIIDGNPLYRPGEGHFYSNFAVESHSEAIEGWGSSEEFGYGITNDLAVFMKTGLSENDGFDEMSWDEFTVGLNYRVVDMGNWKGDVYGVYSLDTVWGDHVPFLDEDVTDYAWTLGARGGYVGDGWTVAGHIDFESGIMDCCFRQNRRNGVFSIVFDRHRRAVPCVFDFCAGQLREFSGEIFCGRCPAEETYGKKTCE